MFRPEDIESHLVRRAHSAPVELTAALAGALCVIAILVAAWSFSDSVGSL